MTKSFKGDICVEPNDFHLVVERFIIGDGEVRFHFNALDKDEDGNWSLEGGARLCNGVYQSDFIRMKFDRSAEVSEMRFQFWDVTATQEHCTFKGQVEQKDCDSWKLSAELEPFNPTN